DLETVRQLMTRHADLTNSSVARGMLEHFDSAISFFKRVMPIDYRRVLEERRMRAVATTTSAASAAT
ncbi:MAG: hypothetical protein AAF561_15320, partial [Planctomycetota bacterium]